MHKVITVVKLQLIKQPLQDLLTCVTLPRSLEINSSDPHTDQPETSAF